MCKEESKAIVQLEQSEEKDKDGEEILVTKPPSVRKPITKRDSKGKTVVMTP